MGTKRRARRMEGQKGFSRVFIVLPKVGSWEGHVEHGWHGCSLRGLSLNILHQHLFDTKCTFIFPTFICTSNMLLLQTAFKISESSIKGILYNGSSYHPYLSSLKQNSKCTMKVLKTFTTIFYVIYIFFFKIIISFCEEWADIILFFFNEKIKQNKILCNPLKHVIVYMLLYLRFKITVVTKLPLKKKIARNSGCY